MERKIKEAIEAEIRERRAVAVEDIVEIIKMYDTRPDPVQLIEQHYRRRARNFLAGIRDENGDRDMFAVKNKAGERFYVNLANEDDPTNLKLVADQLNAKYEGLNRSKKKVQNRQREIANQMQFDFAMNQ